ncbi:hypothetical protein GLW04_14330 [Halobacillus litoralis]|uniref:IDEAL domain-containing protein n=1 Tax=Halobacillus litoralis TaxID=45668 RepID=A0A845E4B1_9BACI|nr:MULTISPECIES: hypothetical protein [Halobacillus]MYL21077.1 hypothetical protein [Halobacillus litoralis]MYL31387.1 hypothetical protein [Halobacillus halophilus]
MEQYLYAVKPFEYRTETTEDSQADVKTLTEGDVLHVTGLPLYVDQMGWFVEVQINDDAPFSMSIPSMDDCYDQGLLFTEMDLDLAINYYEFKIDQSLVSKDEVSFHESKHALDRFKQLHPEFMKA